MVNFLREKNGRVIKFPRVSLACSECSSIFERLPCQIRSEKLFCSKKCKTNYFVKICPPPSRKGYRKYGILNNKNVVEQDKKRKAMWTKAYKKRYAAAGKMTMQEIQRVYEDNIKEYGTLTCVYCLNAIIFGNDSIDHKTPLIRGGKHCYDNLAIACRNCNSKKHTKTYSEFMVK